MLKQVQHDILGVQHDVWGVLGMTIRMGDFVIKEERMKYILFLIAILFSSQAVALNCERQPTCEELNYSKEDNPKCDKNGYILCPYDQSYKKCVQYSCESLGFTQSDKSDWCADIATCKGDKSYTLCQTPCLAWDYDTLSSLASSGKCKVVSMKNDITLSPNQGITLAANTTLDGNGHTLNTAETNLTLAEGSKLQNLNIHRQIATSEAVNFIFINGASTFEDVSILDENSNTDTVEHWRYLCQISGNTLTVRGNLKIEVKNDVRHPIFNGGQLVFENAKVELISPSNSSDVLTQQESIIAKNSEIHIKTLSQAINTSFPELINSQMIIEVDSNGTVFYKNENDKCGIKLGEGSTLDTKTSTLTATPMVEIILNGTTDKPATAIIQKESAGANLDVQNTSAELEYMGNTYHPTQIGQTTLSDVPTSPIWRAE